ncbi:MAG: citrulline utilization hydrolase CtlX [Gammaproteobacteria bacterium]
MTAIPLSETAASAAESFAAAVLVVRPAAFGPNPQTAATNRFQATGGADRTLPAAARGEFDGLVDALADAGVEVIVAEDTLVPPKPDAVFPNNWFTTHADGTAVLYPMFAPSRRAERRVELVNDLNAHYGRMLTAVVDLSGWEQQGFALEGTGSLVLDRRRRIAYVCRSPRSTEAPLAHWARLMGYRVACFNATDPAGVAIYHTNVMLALGRGFALLGSACIVDQDERRQIAAALEADGYKVLKLSWEQIAGFAANVLQLEGKRGPVIAMSEAARTSLGRELCTRLERYGEILAVPIPAIEHYGGGSVRCMLAEIFLPRSPT